MSSSSVAEPSVQALRAEAEANRARLTGTVEDLRAQMTDTATELKDRLSPSAIKAEVTDYVRDSRDQLWNKLEQKARDNPLQAVAVGAAIAYPAFQLLRSMPAPLLLVGAGLLLSRASQTKALPFRTPPGQWRTAHATQWTQPVGALDAAADIARRKLNDAQDYARAGLDKVVERATDTASSVKDSVTEAAGSVKAAVSETADRMTSQAEGLARQARDTVATTWDQNPLLVAGAGLAIGAFIAAAFPSTETEENLFGETSDALRGQAERLAVDAARTAVEGAAQAATEQGLSVDGLTKVGEAFTDKLRAVAERGVDAALGETNPANTDVPMRKSGS